MDQNSSTPGATDPSMEDILASIRRILNEDEVKPEPQDPDVLELDPAMMVEEPGPAPEGAPVPPPPSSPTVIMSSFASANTAAIPQPAASGPTLVNSGTAAAAANSVQELVRTITSERSTAVSRQGPTIEDLVREELRPIVSAWLDQHLPPMVERLVRIEIERVVGRVG